MPAYLPWIFADWHYGSASPELQEYLRAVDADATDIHHTLETLCQTLERIVGERPEIAAEVLCEDGYRGLRLFRLRGGKVEEIPVVERPETGEKRDLPYDHVVDVPMSARLRELLDELPDADGDELPLDYPDEETLRAIADAAATTATELDSFVAEVGHERYLVDISPGHAHVRKLVVATEPDLVHRLRRQDYAQVPPPPRDPAGKYSQALYFPEEMLQEVQDQAVRLDTSLSWIVQFAWKHAGPKVRASDRPRLSSALARYREAGGSTKRKQTIYLPGTMLDELEREAQRLDSSLSFVAQAAFSLAFPEILKQQPKTDWP